MQWEVGKEGEGGSTLCCAGGRRERGRRGVLGVCDGHVDLRDGRRRDTGL